MHTCVCIPHVYMYVTTTCTYVTTNIYFITKIIFNIYYYYYRYCISLHVYYIYVLSKKTQKKLFDVYMYTQVHPVRSVLYVH